MDNSETSVDIQRAIEELRRMTPEELNVWIKMFRGGRTYAEICVHEAAHAVVASRLGIPFDYVTVCPNVTESGDIRAGHVYWGGWADVVQVISNSSESYALALIAPQVALPRFGIERTVAEAQEEFSSDNEVLDILLMGVPDLTRPYLLKRARDMMSNEVLLEIHRLAEELRDRKTLSSEEVRELSRTLKAAA